MPASCPSGSKKFAKVIHISADNTSRQRVNTYLRVSRTKTLIIKDINTVKPLLNGHSKLDKKNLNDRRSKVLQNVPLGAFRNTFDLHQAIIRLENQFVVFLRVILLHRFYYM